jgi:hypothetical protein
MGIDMLWLISAFNFPGKIALFWNVAVAKPPASLHSAKNKLGVLRSVETCIKATQPQKKTSLPKHSTRCHPDGRKAVQEIRPIVGVFQWSLVTGEKGGFSAGGAYGVRDEIGGNTGERGWIKGQGKIITIDKIQPESRGFVRTRIAGIGSPDIGDGRYDRNISGLDAPQDLAGGGVGGGVVDYDPLGVRAEKSVELDPLFNKKPLMVACHNA